MPTRRRTVYRDSETGRFVSYKTFHVSDSHGGTRYRGEYFEIHVKEQPKATELLVNDWRDFDDLADYGGEYEDLEYDGGADYKVRGE